MRPITNLIENGSTSEGISSIEIAQASSTKSLEVFVTEEKGITFSVQECSIKGKSAICHLLLTSKGDDRVIDLAANWSSYRRYSLLFDNYGNEYIAVRVQIGNKAATDHLKYLLPADTATSASLHFENLKPGARKVSLLQLSLWDGTRGEEYLVKLRHIPLVSK